MKTLLLIITTSSLLSVLSFTGCSTAHDVADDTGHVARKAGHVTGHAMEKTGHAVAHGGQELEEHTR